MSTEQRQELQQLVGLLPTEQQQLFESFLKCLSGSGSLQTYHDRLQALLIDSPYPSLQILRLVYDRAKFHIGRIVCAALNQILDDDALFGSTHFISVLANFPQPTMEAAALQQRLLNRLLIESPSREHLLLALMARQDGQLLDDVLCAAQRSLWTQCSEVPPTPHLVLNLALAERQHFVPRLCRQLKDFRCIENGALRNSLLILKLAEEFAHGAQTLDQLGYLEKPLADFDWAEVPAELLKVQQFFYADFQRLRLLQQFLRQHEQINKTLSVDALLRAPGVLTLVYEQHIQFQGTSEQLFRLIEDTYKWQQQMPALKSVHAQELETLNYFTALCHVYDFIVEEQQQQDAARGKLVLLAAQLRQLRSLSILCALLEDIFQLFFLRWEQLPSSNQGETKYRQRHSSAGEDDDGEDEHYVDDDATPPAPPPSHLRRRYGFICRAPTLHALLSYLKSFVTKKRHTEDYRNAAEHVQQRFQRIVDAISEGMWKYGVLQKIDKSMAQATRIGAAFAAGGQLEPEELLQLVSLHSYARDKASSDDESRERSNYASSLTRRRSRKQRRAASFSGGATAAEMPIGRRGAGLTMEQCRVHAQQLLSGGLERRAQLAERSIIPKMLSTPEQLAVLALALKSFTDVKYIIETFNLEHSQLNRELQFMEQQQLVKQKLSNIYGNYLALEAAAQRGSQATTTTVEQIKTVAAKGFELSKIISVVDNFAQAQRLQQSPELKQLLHRHSSHVQYAFLQQYEERNLNALIIADLIVNLRFNREITSNLLLVIRRQQQISQEDDAAVAATSNVQAQTHLQFGKSQLPRQMGAMTLLENLCECMRLLERAGRQPALNELLGLHSYALKPPQLALELQREAAFRQLYSKEPADYSHGRELRAQSPLYQQLQSRLNYYARFCNYVQQLARLLQLRDVHLEYHTTELLKHDPYTVIGELIYECDMTPLEIESNVAALNLNLVHVIALNICPELGNGDRPPASRCGAVQRSVLPQKRDSIHNYIAQHNQLLALLLQAIQFDRFPETTSDELDFSYLQQLVELPEMVTLALMYGDNATVAALLAYQLGSRGTLERLPEELQLQILLMDLAMGGDKGASSASRIDRLIASLIVSDARHIHWAAAVQDIGRRATLLQQHFTKIHSTQLARELIEGTLQHREAAQSIPSSSRCQLEQTLADITVYARVSALLQLETWPQAYDFGRQTPNVIFEQLLQRQLYELCLEWCQVVQLATAHATQHRIFLLTLLDALLEVRDQVDEHLLRIVELFPVSALVNFLDTHKDKLRSLPLLQWVLDYLMSHARDTRVYQNYQVSLAMCRELAPSECQFVWHLLRHPLLIIEQLVMNTKFEVLAKVLPAARAAMQQTAKQSQICPYCFDKRGHSYDLHTAGGAGAGSVVSGAKSGAGASPKVRFQLGQKSLSSSATEAFILLNFNLYQQDHVISNDCVDLLLRIYATKALDFHIADTRSSEQCSLATNTDLQNSLDSLCGAFQMPKEAPTRELWTRDEEATHCMCCRRAAFTMLMRRHHCRRCGRVVCYACSAQRIRIPELYAELEVRVCNDCHGAASEQPDESDQPAARDRDRPSSSLLRHNLVESCKWRLSGIITHDKLLREEFCYEHAPSVALSLSILRHHLGQRQCVELLLFHCRKLEKLIVPNPEVDYELVAKMINCLALAAKGRGAPPELETIREHSEIILAVVQQGCESLIPPGPLNDHSLRQLADALVEAEHWQLALEVHLNFGFPTTGVMAAHGLACLRAGCYDAAREKFAHCMTRLSSEQLNSRIYKQLFGGSEAVSISQQDQTAAPTKRPKRGPALLQEILKLIAATPHAQPQPEALQRASLIRNSNSSLASLFSRRERREPYVLLTPLHEPALNVINTLASLKLIAKGHYSEQQPGRNGAGDERNHRQTRAFEESMHYVLSYGSNADILHFLMQHDELSAALKYLQQEHIEADHFIHSIFQPALASGLLPTLIAELQQLDDDQWSVWRAPLLQTCRHLEHHQQLNSLYQLQLLLKDPIRASMTCVKFYALHCENFQMLHANAQHLQAAHMHLQSELDAAQWEHLQRDRRASGGASGSRFAMQMDARALNGHINTIRRQLEVAKFLAKCEKERNGGALFTEQILKQIRVEAPQATLPTLFEGAADKIQLCILVLLCGRNLDEGFGLAYGIIQDYKLAPMKVFGATAKCLARNQRLSEVERLLSCVTSNNGGGSATELDELLSIAINAAVHSHEPEVKQALDNLAKRISNVELRISSHIFIGQLKSAYLLAHKHERLADIRKILRQAELTNQIHIKKLCEKKLNIHSAPMAPTSL